MVEMSFGIIGLRLENEVSKSVNVEKELDKLQLDTFRQRFRVCRNGERFHVQSSEPTLFLVKSKYMFLGTPTSTFFDSNQILDGLFHGFLFSIPFSAPVLICVSRFLFQGSFLGFVAFLGTFIGHLGFFVFLCANSRTSISIWYTLEPFLAVFGTFLCFGFATDLWSMKVKKNSLEESSKTDRRSGFFSSLFSSFGLKEKMDRFFGSLPFFTSLVSHRTITPAFRAVRVFGFHFLLMFLNPVAPALSTRVLLSASYSFDSFVTLYFLGFFLTSIFFICLIWPLFFSLSIQSIQKGFAFTDALRSPGGIPSGDFSQAWNASPFMWAPSLKATRFLSFLLVGCLLSGSLQYSWRLFTQYPLEGLSSFERSIPVDQTSMNSDIGRTGRGDERDRSSASTEGPFSKGLGEDTSLSTSGKSLQNQPIDGTRRTPWVRIQREFQSFDSSIRHRDKNLPSDRFLPIEKMNSRRTLNGRPPLSEEQKSDAYVRFHAFFINALEKNYENTFVFSRLPENQRRTVDQLEYIQKVKDEFNSFIKANGLRSNAQSSKDRPSSGQVPLDSSSSSSIPLLARPIENNTKGKRGGNGRSPLTAGTESGFSYVRTLISSELPDYSHDELRVYSVLFQNGEG